MYLDMIRQMGFKHSQHFSKNVSFTHLSGGLLSEDEVEAVVPPTTRTIATPIISTETGD
jgi:hypothetical protein